MQGMARLEDSHLQLGLKLHQLIGRKDASWACTYDDHIVVHSCSLQ